MYDRANISAQTYEVLERLAYKVHRECPTGSAQADWRHAEKCLNHYVLKKGHSPLTLESYLAGEISVIAYHFSQRFNLKNPQQDWIDALDVVVQNIPVITYLKSS
jgi:sarcosine oxidase delta subunit